MSQNEPFVSTGSNRLEEMTGDRKKLRGPGFWLLFCILFIGAGFLFGWIFGTLIRGGVDSMTSQPEAPSLVAPTENTGPAMMDQPLEPPEEPASAPQTGEPEGTPIPAGEAPKPADILQNASELPQKKPVTIGETDIYLDEDGVWRNLNRGDVDETRAEGSRPLNRLGGQAAAPSKETLSPIMPGLTPPNRSGQEGLNANDLGGMMNIVSGLLSQGSNQPRQDMDDLSGLMNIIFGLLSEGSGQSGSGPGDIGGMMNMVSGLLPSGDPGQAGLKANDLGGLMNIITGLSGSESGLASGQPSSGSTPQQQIHRGVDGLASDDPIHEIRRKMAAQTQEDQRRTKELKAQIQKNQSGNRFESLDGFEKFDPKDAANIKSSWEYFDDPR